MMIDVAIFPIPNSVNFPGLSTPLHVFEPRYRKMVAHCLEHQLPMGVCHTEKVLHSNDRQQSRDDILNSNQATYKPRDIFSAGPVKLLEELPDGRVLIEVETNIRLQLHHEIQTLPFSIWTCKELPDLPMTDEEARRLEQGKQKILQRLLALTHNNADIQIALSNDYWQSMPAMEFSFSVMGLIALDAELKQELLEMTQPGQRLERVLKLLNG
jgi:Lon protease-like protein